MSTTPHPAPAITNPRYDARLAEILNSPSTRHPAPVEPLEWGTCNGCGTTVYPGGSCECL